MPNSYFFSHRLFFATDYQASICSGPFFYSYEDCVAKNESVFPRMTDEDKTQIMPGSGQVLTCPNQNHFFGACVVAFCPTEGDFPFEFERLRFLVSNRPQIKEQVADWMICSADSIGSVEGTLVWCTTTVLLLLLLMQVAQLVPGITRVLVANSLTITLRPRCGGGGSAGGGGGNRSRLPSAGGSIPLGPAFGSLGRAAVLCAVLLLLGSHGCGGATVSEVMCGGATGSGTQNCCGGVGTVTCVNGTITGGTLNQL